MTPKPSAQGTLAKTPFAHLLLFLNGKGATGSLAVWPEHPSERQGKGQDRLLFHEGQVVGVRPIEATGSALVALSRLFHRHDAPFAFYEGQNLLGTGAGILSERVDLYALLARGLRDAARDDVMDNVLLRVQGKPLRIRAGVPLDRLSLERTEIGFIELMRAAPDTADNLIAISGLKPHDAKRILYLLILIRGVEAAEGTGKVFTSVNPPGQTIPPRAAPSSAGVGSGPKPKPTGADPVGNMARGTLAGTETGGTVSRGTLGGTEPGSSPRATRSDQAKTARTTLGDNTGSVLRQTLGGASGRPPAPVSVPPTVESLPPPPIPVGLNAMDEARWRELTALYVKLDELNHFDLLGIKRDATQQDISNAYFSLVKKFHPDRLPASLTPVTRCAQMIFDRVTEANETLANAAARAEYLRSVEAGGGTRASERMMRDVLESALEFQKAEVLLKRRDYPQAMQILQSALNKNPDEPDYLAMYAWLLHLTNPSDNAPFQEMLGSLDAAIKINPNSERALHYKGVILKRMKQDRAALKCFAKALELNPRNLEAAREVRLASMRKDSKPPPPGPSGKLLSRLFGKGND